MGNIPLPTYKQMQKAQARRNIVGELYVKGWSIRQIADEVGRRLGTKPPAYDTIQRDQKALLAEWREKRVEVMDDLVAKELQATDYAIRELWEQWEKSKLDYSTKKLVRKGEVVRGAGDVQTRGVSEETEEVVSLGDPAYISEIRAQMAERRKLLGLYAPEKKEIRASVLAGMELRVEAFGDFDVPTEEAVIVEDERKEVRQ